MTDFINTNAHAIRVRDEDGQLRRVPAGGVVSGDGGFADALNATNGVRSASSDEVAQSRASEPVSGDARPDAEHVTNALAALRYKTVTEPNQRVVGDTVAPHGPDNGVITTKQAVRANPKDANDLIAYGEPGIDQVAREIEAAPSMHPGLDQAQKAQIEQLSAEAGDVEDGSADDDESEGSGDGSDDGESEGDTKPRSRSRRSKA
ncbi:hypothetical protein [Mycobacterium sp.]|uniref:hypothetical protein n=1 Tax=Mycobacterium sp. TaxID=1785 RepID=UPI0026138533|nr:hypothetical protein [Mycobacterium sp.]